MRQTVRYYTDELNDEFSGAQIDARSIDSSYRYLREGFWNRLAHIVFYRIIAEPAAWIFLKVKFHHTIVGKNLLKQAEGTGYYLYGNHTNAGADALIPSMLTFPAAAHVIVHPNNVSMPVLGRVTPYLGALPLPDDKAAMKHFQQALTTLKAQGKPVVIYPEAHIWPYYTDIRPFKDASFHYPVSMNAPVYCFTNTYQKKRFGFGPKIVTYVDGPFFPEETDADGHRLTPKEKRLGMRNRVYETMKQRAKCSTVHLISYIKKDDNHD